MVSLFVGEMLMEPREKKADLVPEKKPLHTANFKKLE
jgi:hypothetical protein